MSANSIFRLTILKMVLVLFCPPGFSPLQPESTPGCLPSQNHPVMSCVPILGRGQFKNAESRGGNNYTVHLFLAGCMHL